MSEHTEGILHLCTHENETILRDDGGWWVASARSSRRPMQEDAANARRLLACWNNAEGMTTQEIEQGMPLVKVRDTINDQARELNAARALLREVLEADDEALAALKEIGLDSPKELTSMTEKIRAYLDACNTLEGK